jgi:hypothetical protein
MRLKSDYQRSYNGMPKLVLAVGLILATSAYAEIPNSAAISKSKSAVANDMRDPLSVQFRDVKVTGNCNGIKYVTGRANGKNGYGGYAGFTIFLVRIEGNRAVVMQSGGNAYASAAQFHTAAVCNGNASR